MSENKVAETREGFALYLYGTSFFRVRRNTSIKTTTIGLLANVYDNNSWFPEEGILDEVVWDRIQKDIEKANKQGRKIPVQVWATCSLTWTVIKMIKED